jgi:hypothetical protein
VAFYGAGQPVEVVVLIVADDGTNLALGVLLNRLPPVAHFGWFIFVNLQWVKPLERMLIAI